MQRARVVACLLVAASASPPVSSLAALQAAGIEPGSSDEGWNGPRALQLIRRAQEARAYAYADSSLRSFYAEAQGHVYFLGEFRGEREVIRADQLALDVRWQAPDRAVQLIVGRRHEIRLPTDVRYHIDHLALVLDNFGDRIRIGDGDEVSDVLHPAAPASHETYEFRLADSLEIRIRDRTARVFELEVRPVDVRVPGVVGSVFVDRASGAIARMRLTFTKTAYVDRAIVGIVLDLRSAFWDGRYWLPAVQDLEITRSISWFEFPIETVIRTRLEVLDYRLNEEPGVRLGPGQRVATMPAHHLEQFDEWRAPLYDGPIGASDRSDTELEAALRGARDLVRQRGLFGGRRLQLALPDASSGLRARRGEGLSLGAGAAYRIDERARLSLWGGWATNAERVGASAALDIETDAWTFRLEGKLRSLEDVGFDAAAGVVKTLGYLFEGDDYQDSYLSSGGRFSVARASGSTRFELGASIFGHRPMELVVEDVLLSGGGLRPVRPIDAGELVSVDGAMELRLGRALGAEWSLDLDLEAATSTLGDFGFGRAAGRVRAVREGFDAEWAWSSDLTVGISSGEIPAQRLFLLGGRGTLPGYEFRPWGGDRLALLRGEASRSVWSPWIRIRAQAAVGWAGIGDVGRDAGTRFGVVETGGGRASAGLGLALFYDLLRIDVVNGLRSDDPTIRDGWTLLMSLSPILWNVL